MAIVYGLLFLIVGPIVAILIVVIWLVLFIRFGLLTLWLEDLEITVDEKKRITKNVTRVLLGLILFGTPIIIPIIFCIGQEIPEEIFQFLYSRIWLALVIEGWLVLLCYFGLSLFLNWLRISVNQYERVNRNVVMTVLFIGILTGFGGFIWWIYAGTEEFRRWGLIVLSPMTTLLAIGLAVTLLSSLVQALPTEQSDKKYERFAKKLLLTFVLLSVVGGGLSVYPFLSVLRDLPYYL